MLRTPLRSKRRTIHGGVGAATFTPRTVRPQYKAQPSGACKVTLGFPSYVAATGVITGSVSVVLLNAATSRAIPRRLRQSPRLGVGLLSKIWSSSSSTSRTLAPMVVSSGNASSPEASSLSPSSFAEHNMPDDSTPRTLACLMVIPGNCAPTNATGTRIPARTLGAPHTIVSGATPMLT